MPDICATKKTMKTRGHMDKLLVAAAAAADAGEVPVAAAIVNLDGQIITLAENRMKRDGNALHHAEMLAIQAAMAETGQSRLDEYDLWVTLEPCTMCGCYFTRSNKAALLLQRMMKRPVRSNRVFDFLIVHLAITHLRFMAVLVSSEAAALMKEFFAAKR